MGHYKQCHHTPRLTTTQKIHTNNYHHPKQTYHHPPPPKMNLLTPFTTQNKPTTTNHHSMYMQHQPPPPKIHAPPNATTQNIPTATQIKAQKYAKTVPKINPYYLSSFITTWKINWIFNTDNGIKHFRVIFVF